MKNFAIILARPEESRNIGAVCRAMANNDLCDLRIVGKREDFDDERVRILAIHAANIWKDCKFFKSITDAAKDCSIVAGTTRRRGKNRKGKLLLPEEFAEMAFGKSSGAEFTGGATPEGKAAIVFGNERTGLTDDELKECNLGITIPSSENFASLNLSHAVQIVAYHLFRKNLKIIEENGGKPHSSGYTPLTLERIEETVGIITDNLKKIGFFHIAGREDMEIFWKSILARASLSESEAKYLEKIFTKTAGLCGKKISH